MRSDVIRIYKSVHTWTGILSGLVLFIAFFAGALTMFEQSLTRWLTAPTAQLSALSYREADQLIQQVAQQYPAATKAMVLHINDVSTEPSPLRWDNEGVWQASLDANGTLLATPTSHSEFAQFIDQLHQTAGIPGMLGHEPLGVYFMGLISVLYFLALVSGLIILLPTLSKNFLALRRSKNNKRFWLDAHNIVGVTAFPFHVVIALTAVVFAFHDPFYGALQKVVYDDKPMFAPPAVIPIQDQTLDKLLPVATLLERIAAAAPDFHVREIDYRNIDTPKAIARVAGIGEGHIVRGPSYGYLLVQPYSGDIINADMLPGKMETWTGIVSHFFALHFGNYGGNFVRWLYFFLGLSGAFLFFSGNLLWIESRRKRLRNQNNNVQQQRSTRVLAALVIGVSLGTMIGIGLSLVSAKWLHGVVDDINQWHTAIYYLAFSGSLVWALWRSAAVAAFELLYASAATALLIPLTTLLTTLPTTVLTTASPGVDITALAAGLLLFYCAHLSRRRALHGPIDSVWSKYCQ